MADEIIRRDVIQISWDVEDSPLGDLIKDAKEFKSGFTDAMGDSEDALDDLNKDTQSFGKKLKELAKTGFEKLISGLKQIGTKLADIAKKAGVTAFNAVKKLAGVSFKVMAAGIGACVTAVVALTKQAVTAYSEFEQLEGGVKTLFGETAAKEVFAFANDAYKSAGLSANDYMNTVTSFSASLISSLDGDTSAAAKVANTAIVDMSDNANKMGSDMESIQNAYQGFAKQNYTLLDNLKLGYGGTKEEMQRLLKEAGKLSGKTFSISSYADIIEAIHVIQEDLGIAGATHEEASTTIQGSLKSMKAAWGNLLPTLIQGGDAFDQCVDNLVDSAGTFGKNIMPAIQKALGGIGKLIEKAAPLIEEHFPKIVDQLLPPLIKAGTSLMKGLILALPSIVKTLIAELPDIAKELMYAIADVFGLDTGMIDRALGGLKSALQWISDNFEKIKKIAIGAGAAIGGVVVAFKGFTAIKSVTSLFSSLGKSSGDTGKSEGFLGSLAKMKPKTVLKGMANLAIIIGGFTLLAAALMLIAPYMAQLSDFKSILKVVAVIGIVGLLGTGLAWLAGKIGKIPVGTVAKGLANMAIVLVGFGALAAAFLWLSPYMAALGDMQSILKVAAVMTILGVVGGVLAVFAGIVGLIPIPVVLAGLANMALVLGGITLLIEAFGVLSKIPGFVEFLDAGGKVLVKIMGILGEMVGALAGGVIEGLSSCLPALGENLGAFGENIKPLFTAMKGIDMAGVASFFVALVGLLGIATGNEIVQGIKSFFGGGDESSLAKLGTDLSTFAANALPFFLTVTMLPEAGFTKAKQLFECLGGLKGLPADGGVVGWFKGSVDYTKLSEGLGQLSNSNVSGFFTFAAGLEQNGFDNAAALFDCLAGLKSLPKDGGVVGWFTGEVDYSKISEGLGQLSGEKVKGFFEMVAGLKRIAFTNTKALFEALAGLGDLPNSGGLVSWFTGDNTLGDIADDLGSFAEKSGDFFTAVNGLNIENLNGLWDSLKKPGELSTDVLKTVSENIDDIVDKIADLPKRMGSAIKESGASLSSAIVSIWKDAVTASVAPVNKLLDGCNVLLKQFGSEKRVANWKPYARGTSGHPGGNAIVNDGRGAELVQMPNGNTFIPGGRNVLLPNAPKGMKVLSAENTARLMGRSGPTFNYASGIGSDIGEALTATIKPAMEKWLDNEIGAKTLADYDPSKGVDQWKSTVIRALKMEGQYTAANVKRTLYQMQTESGGNPRAINLWDSNAKKGIPSKGLMQVIDPTFKAYARKGFASSIYDPLSNILASVRYAASRYGTLEKAYQGHGYSGGVGTVSLPYYTPAASVTSGHSTATQNNSYAPSFNLTMNGTVDRTTERVVKKWVQDAIEDALERMSRTTPRLTEV